MTRINSALGRELSRRLTMDDMGPTMNWICEFCYKPASGDLPHSWELIFQSAVCQDCQKKIAEIGGYKKVIGGAFAFADDPRLALSEVR